MKTIGEYRARYPQLRELTDYQLTRAVYDTTAPDMPLEDFAKAFGGVTEEDPEEVRIQEYNLSHPDDTIRREVSAFSAVTSSELIQRMLTVAWLAMPPCLSASTTLI